MAEAGTIHDVAIIGAGSAGIAAAKTARELGLDYVVLEASHRIGGRGYTEELAPGVAFDLGCHWLHTASLNPYVAIADRFGFTYRKGTFPRGLWINGHWATEAELEAYGAAWQRYHAGVMAAGAAGKGISILDATERESRWTPLLDYWTSIAYAARHPERVSHLVLYGGFARGLRRRGTQQAIERADVLTAVIRHGWANENPAYRQLFTSLFIPGASLEQMQKMFWQQFDPNAAKKK